MSQNLLGEVTELEIRRWQEWIEFLAKELMKLENGRQLAVLEGELRWCSSLILRYRQYLDRAEKRVDELRERMKFENKHDNSPSLVTPEAPEGIDNMSPAKVAFKVEKSKTTETKDAFEDEVIVPEEAIAEEAELELGEKISENDQ